MPTLLAAAAKMHQHKAQHRYKKKEHWDDSCFAHFWRENFVTN